MDRIYLYDSEKKMELFGTFVSSDYTEAERALQDDCYLYCRSCITIERRVPLGSLLTDALSLDFDRLMELIKRKEWSTLENVLGLSIDPARILMDINVLYVLKEYIDVCNKFPGFFTQDHFAGLLSRFEMFPIGYDNDPELIGDFVDDTALSQDEIVLESKVDLILAEKMIALSTYHFCCNAPIVRDIMMTHWLLNPSHKNQIPVYRLSRGTTAIMATMYTLLKEGMMPKKCQICGKYFVPLKRSDAIYCDRVSPLDPQRTCKEYGAQKLWYDRIKHDEVAKLSRNIYNAKQMLVRRNPDRPEYKKMFEYFRAERKKWDAWVESGEKSKEEFINWLNEMKAKKML